MGTSTSVPSSAVCSLQAVSTHQAQMTGGKLNVDKPISLGQRDPSQCEQIIIGFGQNWKTSAGRSLSRFSKQRETPFIPTAEDRSQNWKRLETEVSCVSQSVTPETPTLVMQHHGNSHCLLCGGLYHQAWGSMVFSSSGAGFLGQPATQGCCTAYWANISLEGMEI